MSSGHLGQHSPSEICGLEHSVEGHLRAKQVTVPLWHSHDVHASRWKCSPGKRWNEKYVRNGKNYRETYKRKANNSKKGYARKILKNLEVGLLSLSSCMRTKYGIRYPVLLWEYLVHKWEFTVHIWNYTVPIYMGTYW